MNQDNFDIISKWLIKGFPQYCFGSDNELYRFPYKTGKNYYSIRKVKKQVHNRWLIHGKFWSERQLKGKLYLNPDPEIIVKGEEMPF
ncbi:MAG TPA: hypothetical protein VIH28_08490 [Ignavibacteriaceae bacterium]